MKKLGFTLSELLVAVGIVAVVSLVVAPTVTDIIPDKNKIKVINYYNKINEVNQKLLNDKNLYYTQYTINKDGEKEITAYGLANTEKPIDDKICTLVTNCRGASKYAALFIYSLIGENKDNPFRYTDNSYWIIKPKFNYSVIPKTVVYTISVNLNNGKNCSYSTTCQQPDTFIFKVDENGNVTAGDAMTDAYLSNVSKTNNKKEDKELAKKYLSEKSY